MARKRTKEEKIDIHFKHIEKLKKKIEYHEKMIEKISQEETKYQILLKDKRWIEKRNEILDLLGRKCSSCGATTNLHVHHKYYNFDLKPWEYPNEAFLVLCKECHDKTHNILK